MHVEKLADAHVANEHQSFCVLWLLAQAL